MVRIKYGRNAAKATTADAEPEPTAGPSDTISNGAPPPTEPAAADAQHATTQATTAPPKRPKGRPRKNPAPVVRKRRSNADIFAFSIPGPCLLAIPGGWVAFAFGPSVKDGRIFSCLLFTQAAQQQQLAGFASSLGYCACVYNTLVGRAETQTACGVCNLG